MPERFTDWIICRVGDAAFLILLGACGVLATKAIIFIAGG